MKVTFKLFVFFVLINLINCLNKQKNCNCRILPKIKIFNGKQAHHLAYPWIVSLTPILDKTPKSLRQYINDEHKLNYHSCEGSIINEKLILTSAHCIPENNNDLLYAGYGNDNDLVKIFDFGRIESTKLISNPDYITNSPNKKLYYDIAIIELKKPIQFSEYVEPACYLKQDEEFYSNSLEYTNWKAIKKNINNDSLSDGKYSRYLSEKLVIDESNISNDCKINKQIICSKEIEKDKLKCKDSLGGLLHYTKNGKSFVVGLSSYLSEQYFEDENSNICVGKTTYTKISSFIDWIKLYAGEDICIF